MAKSVEYRECHASAAATAKSLEYVGPGRGRDISRYRAGREGFERAIEEFRAAAASTSYDRKQPDEMAVLVGDFGVGKTCLLKRYAEDCFPKEVESTIGVGMFKHTYTCRGYNFILCLCDTAGQEQYKSLPTQFYRCPQACIVAFDLGVPATLRHVEQWVAKVKRVNVHADDLCLFLVGCKSDMFHVVSDTQAEQVAVKLGAEYFEVSAKSEEAITVTPREEDSEDDLLAEFGYGQGTENWKVDKASRKSTCCCCWTS